MTDRPSVRERVRKASKRAVGLIKKVVFWRIPALAFWFWLLAVQGRQTELDWLKHVWVLALLPIVGLLLGKPRILVASFPLSLPFYYFVGFPSVMVYDASNTILTLFRTAFTGARQATRSRLFVWLLALVYGAILLAISLLGSKAALWPLAWAALGVGIPLVTIVGLRWAMDPFVLPGLLLRTSLHAIRLWAAANVQLEISEQETRSKIETAGRWLAKSLLDENHESGVSRAVRHLCIPVSLAGLATLFLVLSLGFGFSYYAMWEAKSAFHASSPVSLPIALYYALSVGVTAPSGTMVPVAWPAFIVQGIQHASSVFVVALIPGALFFSLSVRRNEYYCEANSHILDTRQILLNLWNESKERETKAKDRKSKREKPQSMREALGRLADAIAKAGSSDTKDDQTADEGGSGSDQSGEPDASVGH